MDSIAEFIFVHGGKASRVHGRVSPPALVMPSASSTFRGQTNAVGWLAVLRSAERSTVVQNENMVAGAGGHLFY